MTIVPNPVAVELGATVEAEVVVIVVTYNSAAIIERFVCALPAALDGVASAHVIVIDNASTDGTAELVRAIAPWAMVIDAGDNLGYGAAVNIGLQRARPRRGAYILNADAVPSPGSIATLASALDRASRVGLAVPTMLDDVGRRQCSLRREPTLLRAVGHAVLGGNLSSKFAPLGERIVDPDAYVDGATADWATGAAVMISRSVLDQIGPWAEDYFLYSEETDYALRARDAGYQLEFVPQAVVKHAGGDQSQSPWLWSLHAVNRVRLYRRRHGRILTAAYWATQVLNEALRALGGQPTHRAALLALATGHAVHRPGRRVVTHRP